MGKKQNISVNIQLDAKIDQVQKNLNELRKNFSKISLSDSIQNEFSNLFANIEKEFEKIAKHTASGKLNLIDAGSVEKSINKINDLYASLSRKMQQRGVAKAGLKEDEAVLNSLVVATKLCEKASKSNVIQENKLVEALEEEKQKREALLELQQQQQTVTEEELQAQNLKIEAAKRAERAAKKELEAKKAALDEKIANSNGVYSEAQMGQKGSGLRKTKAYREYQAATTNYTQAKDTTKKEKETIKTMTTAKMQAEEMKKVEDAIVAATEKLKQFQETGAKENLSEALKKAKEQLQSFTNVDFTKYGIKIEDIQSVEQLQQVLEELQQTTDKKTAKNLKEIAKRVEEVGKVCEDTTGDIKNSTNALNDQNEKAKQVDAFYDRVKAILSFKGATQLLQAAIRNAISTIKELDATMTEMSVVTDLNVGDYWDQLPEYTKRANELGLAINDVYKADTLFYQQGLKTEEVIAISTETMKMARIAGLDTAEATDRMTAALRGFNMELNEASAQKIADVYSELAAITAADVDEISTAMTKTASIASSAGMEFETTAAFLSQIIETTRESAETAGTALKTVIARFQELKKSPGEIGEVDGEIVDANKIETALRSVGVALRDSSGQFRDLDDVFLELSSKWDTLDKNTQRYIATIAAGSRQQSRFIAMMSDYSRTQELVSAANNSAGASAAQFEKTMDSLESKLAKLKNAWNEFSMGILESDLNNDCYKDWEQNLLCL